MPNAPSSIDVKWSSISTCPFISCTAVHNYRSAQFLYSRSGWWGSNVVLNRQHCASVQVYRHANSRLGEAGCRGLKTQDLTHQSIFIYALNLHHGFNIRQDLGHQNIKVTRAFISLVGRRYDATSIKSKDI